MMRLLSVLVLLVPLMVPATHAEPASFGDGGYIAGMGPLVLWCSSEPHPFDPDPNDLEDYTDPVRWLLGEEPECAPADALNAAREAQGKPRIAWGLNGFIWAVPDEYAGRPIRVSATNNQPAFLTPFLEVSYRAGSTYSVSGCGPQVVVLPPDASEHWLSTPDNRLLALRVRIPAIEVVDGFVCRADVGLVRADLL